MKDESGASNLDETTRYVRISFMSVANFIISRVEPSGTRVKDVILFLSQWNGLPLVVLALFDIVILKHK